MPVTRLSPPSNVTDASTTGLTRFVSGDAARGFGAPIVQQVYIAGLKDLSTRGTLREMAHYRGWRFIGGGQTGEPVASFVTDSGDKPATLTSVSFGSRLQAVLEAENNLDNSTSSIPELQSRQFELRILRIPCLLIEAFWLTPVDGRGGPDWICPYQTKVPGLQPRRGRTFVPFMSEDEFLGICRPLAEERIARDGGIEKPYE